MIYSYTVCSYCFEKLNTGYNCNCLASQGAPKKTSLRYTDIKNAQLKECQPNILGEEVNEEYGGRADVSITLAPWVSLQGEDLEDFNDAVAFIAEVIERSLSVNELLEEEETLTSIDDDEEK